MLWQIGTIVFGLVIGSFLTVCIYRIPYGREKGPGNFGESDDSEERDPEAESSADAETLSIVTPKRSFCPECKQTLKWWQNIPLLSWLILGGSCAFCKAKIPVRYPAVELLSVLSCLVAFNRYDFATGLVVYSFLCALIVISFIDIDYYIIPNVITYPGMLIGPVLALTNQYTSIFTEPVAANLTEALLGLLAGGGFLFAVSETYYLVRRRVGLGFGDVKLLAMVGLVFGPKAALWTIFIGSLVGTFFGVAQLLLLGHSLSKPLPFGPYLASGTAIFLYVGHEQLRILSQRVVIFLLEH